MTTAVADALVARRRPASAVLDNIAPEADVIVGLGNGEPATVVDAIEQGASGLHVVRLHQSCRFWASTSPTPSTLR